MTFHEYDFHLVDLVEEALRESGEDISYDDLFDLLDALPGDVPSRRFLSRLEDEVGDLARRVSELRASKPPEAASPTGGRGV